MYEYNTNTCDYFLNIRKAHYWIYTCSSCLWSWLVFLNKCYQTLVLPRSEMFTPYFVADLFLSVLLSTMSGFFQYFTIFEGEIWCTLELNHTTDWSEEILERKHFVWDIRSLFVYKWNVNLSGELICESNKLAFILYDEVLFSSVNSMYYVSFLYNVVHNIVCCCLFSWRYNPSWLYFYSPVAGFSLLVFEVSWSHTTTYHSL